MPNNNIIGTCTSMCSEEEQSSREKYFQVSEFEATEETKFLDLKNRKIDTRKAVKKYIRTGSSYQTADAGKVRTPSTLLETVRYLLCEVYSNVEYQERCPCKLYSFVSDGLEAVRQDLVVQGLFNSISCEIYHAIVRFHILARYLLSENGPPDYDPYMNIKILSSALGTLNSIYAKNILSINPIIKSEMTAYMILIQVIKSLHFSSDTYKNDITGLDLELLLKDVIPQELKEQGHIKYAMSFVKNLMLWNYTELFKLFYVDENNEDNMINFTLIRCLSHGFLHVIRSRAITVLNKSFPKEEKVTFKDLSRILAYNINDIKDMISFCQLHNLPVEIIEEKEEPVSILGHAIFKVTKSLEILFSKDQVERNYQTKILYKRQDELILRLQIEGSSSILQSHYIQNILGYP